VSWARLIRYTCDRCGHSEDLVLTEVGAPVEPRLPEPGWSTMMLYSKAQTEGETLDRALCVNCTAEVIGWLANSDRLLRAAENRENVSLTWRSEAR
jgi:ribosomal protein S27AE